MSAADEHRASAVARVRVAVLTVSDTRTPDDDASGRLLREGLTAAGHDVVAYAVLRDEPDALRREVRRLIESGAAQIVVTTGGTGIAARDTTYEALDGLIEKRLDGFGELFRMLSYAQVGAAAMMSRAVAGTYRGGFIVALPGSTDAVALALTKILLPELAHLAKLAARSAIPAVAATTSTIAPAEASGASSGVIVRAAEPRDLEAAAQLAGKLVHFHQALDPERYMKMERIEAGYRQWFEKELARPKQVVLLVAEHGTELVGYAYGRIEEADWNLLLAAHGALHDLWVEPDARRSGVASRLVTTMCAELKALGAPRVLLHTAWQNAHAHAFFETLGFRRTMLEMTREA